MSHPGGPQSNVCRTVLDERLPACLCGHKIPASKPAGITGLLGLGTSLASRDGL
jgi:hypothetical protein